MIKYKMSRVLNVVRKYPLTVYELVASSGFLLIEPIYFFYLGLPLTAITFAYELYVRRLKL